MERVPSQLMKMLFNAGAYLDQFYEEGVTPQLETPAADTQAKESLTWILFVVHYFLCISASVPKPSDKM